MFSYFKNLFIKSTILTAIDGEPIIAMHLRGFNTAQISQDIFDFGKSHKNNKDLRKKCKNNYIIAMHYCCLYHDFIKKNQSELTLSPNIIFMIASQLSGNYYSKPLFVSIKREEEEYLNASLNYIKKEGERITGRS